MEFSFFKCFEFVWNGVTESMSWTPAWDKVEGEEEEITLFFCWLMSNYKFVFNLLI